MALEFGTMYIFLLQHGGAVPAELPEDGGAVAGGEHKGAVQRLHGRCQVRALQWLGYSTVQYSDWGRTRRGSTATTPRMSGEGLSIMRIETFTVKSLLMGKSRWI